MTVKFCFTGFVKHSKALGCLLIYRLCYLILAVMDSGGVLYFVSTFRYSPSFNRTKCFYLAIVGLNEKAVDKDKRIMCYSFKI